MANVKEVMTVTESKRSELLAEIAAVSGASTGDVPGTVDAAFLRDLTQKQLQELAKRLAIPGYSRLNKDALAGRIWVEVEPVLADGVAHVADTEEPHLRNVPGRDIPVIQRFEAVPLPEPIHDGPVVAKEIPWGYARDRVTAMPVDPERLFVYWEVLEDSIAKARIQLGNGGASAWLNLRLYDTTGRIFDGSNAHSVRDQLVDRTSRQWFFDIGKPTAEMFVEVGLLSSEGYFVRVARSGRIEFPRREAVAWSEPEWMTVRVATGHVERSNVRSQMKSTGSAHPAAPTPPPGMEGLPTWVLKQVDWQDVARFALSAPEQRVEWEELRTEGTVAFHRRISWESPTMITSWESGPLSYPVEVPLPVRESFVGKTRVFKTGDRTHIVYGPWQVVIRGLGAHHSRVVLSRWEVFRSWQTHSEHDVEEVTLGPAVGGGVGASERLLRGSSERSYAGGSELRLGGSSELHFLGASEVRMGGASEIMYAGASERVLAGSSEARFLGASEDRLAKPVGAYPSTTAASAESGAIPLKSHQPTRNG